MPCLAPCIAEDFHLSHTELGILSGVLALAWALSGLVAGRVSDKLGRRKPILIAAVVLFSCFSAAGGLMTGFLGLLVARALMGVAEGAVLPLAQSLMVEASRESRRGLNMGLLQGSSAGLMGGILAPLAVAWIAEAHGWRTPLLLTIVPGLLLAVWIAKSVREVPPGGPAQIAAAEVVPEATAGPKPSVREVLGHRNIVLCMAAAGCCPRGSGNVSRSPRFTRFGPLGSGTLAGASGWRGCALFVGTGTRVAGILGTVGVGVAHRPPAMRAVAECLPQP